MFTHLRRRLLIAYLLVLTGILLTFAVGTRLLFYHVLNQKYTERLVTVAQGAIANVETKNGQLQFDQDLQSSLAASTNNPKLQELVTDQGVEIFDIRGQRVAQSGKIALTLPFSVQQPIQFQSGQVRSQAITLPVIDRGTNQTVGYVRSSQQLAELDESLTKLDLGLSGGILLALLLSAVGGVWLTKQAMQPVENSFQRLQQFTADASHELRSPLMAIKSNAQVALKYPEGIRAGDLDKFQSIDSATIQMTRLTEDLLWLARTDGDSRQQWQAVDLTQVLENVLKVHQKLAMTKKILLRGEVDPDLIVIGDQLQLLRIFNNLVENAIYYTLDEGSVLVRAGRVRQRVRIQIQNTGIGIAPDHLAKIFDRFWRADTSRTQWIGGSGLGLSIVQSIVVRHGGEITVSSKIAGGDAINSDQGTCFTVYLSNS